MVTPRLPLPHGWTPVDFAGVRLGFDGHVCLSTRRNLGGHMSATASARVSHISVEPDIGKSGRCHNVNRSSDMQQRCDCPQLWLELPVAVHSAHYSIDSVAAAYPAPALCSSKRPRSARTYRACCASTSRAHAGHAGSSRVAGRVTCRRREARRAVNGRAGGEATCAVSAAAPAQTRKNLRRDAL